MTDNEFNWYGGEVDHELVKVLVAERRKQMQPITQEQVVNRLMAHMAANRLKQVDIAKKLGCSGALVSQVLRGLKSPTPKMCKLVGVKRIVAYVESN
jgi:predicted XRE-type DNA-binding protein